MCICPSAIPAYSWMSGAVSSTSPLHGNGRTCSGPLKPLWRKVQWFVSCYSYPNCQSCWCSYCSYTPAVPSVLSLSWRTNSGSSIHQELVHMVDLFCCISFLFDNVITVCRWHPACAWMSGGSWSSSTGLVSVALWYTCTFTFPSSVWEVSVSRNGILPPHLWLIRECYAHCCVDGV